MLLAVRDALARADGVGIDLDALARQLDVDRAALRAAVQHGIAQGWLPDVELVALPAGCGSTGCAPVSSSPACRRCPLAG